MEKFEVYILYSRSLEKYYVGQTSNFADRFMRHNEGRSKSTKNGIPWELVIKFDANSRSEALHLEAKIKGRGIKRYLIDNKINWENHPNFGV